MFIIFTVITLCYAAIAFAVPQTMSYQGILRDSNGDLQDGTFPMTLKIYDAVTGGNLEYTHGPTNAAVSNGLYNIEMPATAEVFDGSNRWLEITVGSDTLAPRLKINSVAYAIRAETVDDNAITGAKLANDININTTGSIAATTLTIDNFLTGGTGDGFCVGTGEINASNVTTITNANVTNNSIILATMNYGTDTTYFETNEALVVYYIEGSTTSFKVGTVTRTAPANPIKFNYLIIN